MADQQEAPAGKGFDPSKPYQERFGGDMKDPCKYIQNGIRYDAAGNEIGKASREGAVSILAAARSRRFPTLSG